MMLLRVFGRACEDWLCFKKDACPDVVEGLSKELDICLYGIALVLHSDWSLA
jgi:hypothetical protein